MIDETARVVLQVPVAGRLDWRVLESPEEIVSAYRLEEVRPALRRVEEAAERGLIGAGFVAYEAAPAFDSALRVAPPLDLPLVWFGLFTASRSLARPLSLPADWQPLAWSSCWTQDRHAAAVDRIRDYIARGDVYQVNLTTRLRSLFDGDPLQLFAALCHGQKARYSAYVDAGDWVLCSASPELFLRIDHDRLLSRPMKGTCERGRTSDEDRERGNWLRGSTKNRAENLMIVDMIRNDLGRVARPDSVHVSSLWQLEKYPSLFQLTSTIEALSDASIDQILAALFPCASVTGAPKVRAMEIIQELEQTPRGAYTGAIGTIGPGRRARFNVAIRTVRLDRRSGLAEYGTGGGIVWDSNALQEWRECQTKALVLGPPDPSFEIFETLLWQPGKGFRLLERHLARARDSCDYFDYPFDPPEAAARLHELAERLPNRPQRVRLSVSASGELHLEAAPLEDARRPWKLALARDPVASSDRFLFHKTTHRSVYDQHRRQFLQYDDVLLWNELGDLTESTVANLVVRRGDRLLTPPVTSGLLAGTLRAELIDRGEIVEERIAKKSLTPTDRLFLINSVRGWIEARLAQDSDSTNSETRPAHPA